LADTKACTLIGCPLRVVALVLGLKHQTCKRVGRAHLFARGRYFHIDNLLSARLAFPNLDGATEKGNNHLISCPSCSPDSLLPFTLAVTRRLPLVLFTKRVLISLDFPCDQAANHIALRLNPIRHGLFLLRSKLIAATNTLLLGDDD